MQWEWKNVKHSNRSLMARYIGNCTLKQSSRWTESCGSLTRITRCNDRKMLENNCINDAEYMGKCLSLGIREQFIPL